jgi:PAS domain S-box-containing protein
LGPYVTVNTVLIGFFAFAALHYMFVWWFSHGRRVLLLIAATSGVCAVLLWYLVQLSVAQTVPEYVAALNQRTNWSLVGVTLTAWVLAEAARIAARPYLWFVTAFFGAALLSNLFWFPLAGPIDGLDPLTLPWGEQIALAKRPPPEWWGVPLYAVALSVDVFGLFAGYRLYQRDRLAGLLVFVATIGDAAALSTGILVDLLHWRIPYVGDWPYAIWIVLIGVILAREYRRNREELAESESRYRLIVANQTEFVVKWRPNGTRTFVNDSYCRYFGLTRSRCLGTSAISLVAPEHRQKMIEKVAALTPEAPEAVDEHLCYDAEGKLRWHEWRCRGLFDQVGRLVEIVSTGRDVTERRITEETIRRNEERYRLLTDQARLVLWEGDPETLLFTYVSESAEGLLGVPAARWYEPGFWPAHIFAEDREEALTSCRLSTARREDHRFEYRMVRGDGQVIWVEDTVKVIVGDDGKVSLRGLLIDITARKAADEELRASRQLFGSAFDFAPVGMAIVALDGRLLQVNQAMCRMLGYTEDELRRMDVRQITHPEDLAGDEALVRRAIAGEIPHYELEKRYLHRDGRVIWGLLFVSLVRNAAGTPVYGVAQVQDMTERRRLEEELRHSQKMEAIGRLAGGIAHDFNNIITVVSTYGSLLRERLPASDANQEAVQAVLDAADRASRLTRQILAFSRKQQLQPAIVDVNHVVREMQPLLDRLLMRETELVLELAEEACLIRGDRHQFEQVVMNLAVNARDAMSPGGRLTIGVRLRSAGEVDEAIRGDSTADTYVELSVTDTGAGIDEEIKHRVFEPFFTTKPPGKGTGLGLAVVYGIVRQSGGHVEIDSRVGVGTTIFVRLPGVREPAEPAPAAESRDIDGALILLVDDEATVRTAVKNILQEAGFRVLPAEHGARAIELLKGGVEVRLVLTDLIMPDVGGREVAAQARRMRPAPPVVLMSGRHDELERVGRADGLPIVEKPFTAAGLVETVRRALEAAHDGDGRNGRGPLIG